MTITRRTFLGSAVALAAGSVLAGPSASAATAAEPHRLTAAPGRLPVLGADAPETEVLAYNGSVPGPTYRVRPGTDFALAFENALDRPTTVHWHGLRVPNAMDGVPDLTQTPIAPGARFRYAFPIRNPGTYWYHPHFQSAEQLDRGLHGVIIVEDEAPPPVDRDVLWVLDDWRLGGDGQITDDFGDLHDASHQGRFGNTATVNGRVPEDFRVRAGERIRLRLVNVANAWIFGLDFAGHAPLVIAYDGHAVIPHRPPGGLVVLGPSQRVDLILDLGGTPGNRFEVTDRYYQRQQYKLLDIVYDEERLRDRPPETAVALPAPDLPVPDLAGAERHRITFSGGAMGGMRSARLDGDTLGIRELARQGKVWAINGVVANRHDEPPMLGLRLGRTYILEFENETAFPHPIHLHGQPMQVLESEGVRPAGTLWRDTLLLDARARGSVAVVADNPGLWMLHCHIPEHQEAGMMAVIEVS